MLKRWDVLGVGCNSVDYVYRVPAPPLADSPTAKLRIREHATMCGGQTATAMAACSSFGLRAAYLGAVGDDQNGRLVLSELERRGVDTTLVMTRPCPNRFAVITVDPNGDRIVLWDRDDRLNLTTSDIDRGVIALARLLHVDDEDPEAAITAALVARDAGVPSTSDIDRVTDRTAALIDAVTIPIFAQHVPSEMSGVANLERAVRKLRKPHHELVGVTLGASGAALLVGDAWLVDAPPPVAAVDTTGAGDVFRAALIYARLSGYQPRELLRFANAAAALSCTRRGALPGVPSLEDVQRFTGG